MWLLRLALAPASTLAGFRAWVLEECPVAPGRRAPRPARRRSGPAAPQPDGPAEGDQDRPVPFFGHRTDTGHLPPSPLIASPRISAALAPQAGLNTGAARAALRKAVLAAQNGDPR